MLFNFLLIINCPNKYMRCVTGGCWMRMGCVVYECMEVISVGFMDPLDHPHLFHQRPAAGCGAPLCVPFVMRCHLALLAVRSLLRSACDTPH